MMIYSQVNNLEKMLHTGKQNRSLTKATKVASKVQESAESETVKWSKKDWTRGEIKYAEIQRRNANYVYKLTD